MKRIFWSRRRRPRPGHFSTSPWASCLGFGCAGGESQAVPRYLAGYCAVGQLHRAASVGAVATVERFLTFRVNGVNDPDKKNRTALHYACAHGHLGVVTLLIERNCNINACDDDNCTPLIKASQHQHGDCVAALLQHGADPNAVDALGNTALHYAVHSENTFIASQLLEHSANIEAKTKVEEERKYGLQEPNVAVENSDDRTACAVASAAAAAAVSASTYAESASTSASAASNIASAAFASASAASTSASVAFASASAASTSAASASASASASDASAAAAAASASASDASAAAAAAAAASAVASSNATVNAVVAAAVTAAFAAVTATADIKGSEPTPQRHSGATNDKDFALKAKEEHDKREPATHLMKMNRSENKGYFPGDSMATFEKCAADTSAEPPVKQSCARQLHQDGQSPAKSTSKEKHEAKKQINGVEGLEDGTLPCEAASDDCWKLSVSS
eukprot:XP_017171839.1 PREDICTED: ankyrin repeat domain-containing protein 30B isoform X3 [Mus musculus]